MLQRIAQTWLALVTGVMADLQTSARLTCRLVTRQVLHGETLGLVLGVVNEGRAAAVSLGVQALPGPGYAVIGDGETLAQLAPGDEAQVQVPIRPTPGAGLERLRVRFALRFSDPRGPDQVEHFADVVSLLEAEETFQFVPNPYAVGTPLQPGSPLFIGREDLVASIQEHLAASHRNHLVIIGQRRMGKTSLLKQLGLRLGDEHVPVYLDGQTLGIDPGLAGFFTAFATDVAYGLEDRGFGLEPPDPARFAEQPALVFEREFLREVRQVIGDRHLLVLLDEFEALEAAVRRGTLDPAVFGWLRHLIQHTDRLSLIFCGTHRLEELAADYWSVLFNICLYQHVGFLTRAQSERLIQEPVAPFGVRLDDLALEKMWQVTSGHPRCWPPSPRSSGARSRPAASRRSPPSTRWRTRRAAWPSRPRSGA